MKVCIAQFAKSPLIGQVKTRLVPPLSYSEAKRLHENLVRYVAREVSLADEVQHILWSTVGGDFIERLVLELPRCSHRIQRGSNLGARLSYAAKVMLENFEAIILIGSDCPYITRGIIGQAIDLLTKTEVVIGPADDGGYVLMGLKRYQRELFDDIQWGTPMVFEQTMQAISRIELSVAVMASLPDIDRPQDLELLRQQPRFADLLAVEQCQ